MAHLVKALAAKTNDKSSTAVAIFKLWHACTLHCLHQKSKTKTTIKGNETK